MTSRIAYALVPLSPISVAAQNTAGRKARLTPQQAILERRLRDFRWSANGGGLAFTVSDSPASRELREFTNSPKSESHPRRSPEDRQLAFLSDREEFQQIFIISSNDGEAARIESLWRGNRARALSARRSRIRKTSGGSLKPPHHRV
jgi:Tol biopolymer transport system component